MLSGLVIVGLFTIAPMAAEDVPRVTNEVLVRYLDNAEVYVLDVRTEEDWKDSEFKIKGVLREEPKNFNFCTKVPRRSGIRLILCRS